MKKILLIAVGIVILCVIFANVGDGEIERDGTLSDTSTVQSENSSIPNATENKTYFVGDYGVRIKDARLAQDTDGENIFIVTYDFINNTENPQSFVYAFTAHAYQNGIELYTVDSVWIGEDVEYKDTKGTNIKSGVSIEVDIAYRLTDASSDVEVEVGNTLMSLAGEEPLRQIFSIVE